MEKLFAPLIILLHILIFNASAQTGNNEVKLMKGIENISQSPIIIEYKNSFNIINEGGHLQGIQTFTGGKSEYFIFSGSSSEYSYYSIVKIGTENMVISVNKILEKPFKHAGGFQIYNHLMAIGVEDNDERNKSKVFIFDLKKPENPAREPLAIIDRMGTKNRATAGCVGIITIHDKVLVVVGDWDTAHLDFYRIDEEKLYDEGATLELEYSMDTKKIDKSGWVDQEWLSYQNINFIIDPSGTLYLAGMTSNLAEENVVDVYEVISPDLTIFELKKVYSRKIPGQNLTKFRWGAGISQNEDGSVIIYSCGEHIENESVLHIYK